MLLLMLACTAEPDTGDTANLDFSTTQETGSYSLSYLTEPDPLPFNERFDLILTVDAGAGLEVVVDARMPAHGHGMTVTPEVTDHGDGTYTASPLLFSMEGLWQIPVVVEGETAVFNVWMQR